MREFVKKDYTVCLKKGLVSIFTLTNPDGIFPYIHRKRLMSLLTLLPLVLYEDAEEVVECGQGCKEAGHCLCSLCWSAKEFRIRK